MSLEAALAANTAAVNQLAAAFLAMGGTQRAIPDAPAGMVGRPATISKEEANPEHTKAAVQAELDRVKAENAAAAAAAAKAAGPAAPAAAPVTLGYETHVKPAGTALVKAKGREKLIEILATFGVTNAKDLKPEQFADAVAALNAAASAA